jgi:hypothetical protein
VRAAIHDAGGRRLVVSAGGAVAATSPLSNIRAVREAVE